VSDIHIRANRQSRDPVLEPLIESARTKCARALGGPLAGAGESLRSAGIDAGARRELLRSLWRDGRYPAALAVAVREARARTDAPGAFLFERRLLVEESLAALGRLDGLPVPASVKACLCREFDFFAEPPEDQLSQFDPLLYPARAYAAIAILERFPAGQLSWERDGLPRSWLLRARLPDAPGLLRAAALGLKGFRPAFCAHVTVHRGRIPVLMERACKISFWRIAQALRMQPEVRGIVTSSWLYDPQTCGVSPHLAWMRSLFLENGGALADIGEAPSGSGFLEGNLRRRQLFIAGEYTPREYAAVWPRRAVIDWAARHPEFSAEP